MNEVLLIDDNGARRDAMAATLSDHGMNVSTSASVPDTVAADCVLAMDAQLSRHITQIGQQAALIVLTEQGSIPAAVAAIQQGAANYLCLPLEPEHLVAAIERAQQQKPKTRDNSLENFPMVGVSETMRALKAGISKAAPTNSTVLILGQSGTGKELVARAIHSASDRGGAPLISINCATVPANLIESELFGAEGLDGAGAPQPGLVDAANGGTLFLDEISELPPAAQARLLRVLQGENRRVGSSSAHAVDVRLIAATHQNLENLVAGGQFREDLYYRLNVVCFDLPPLHARREDIIPIATWLLERACTRLGKQQLSFSPDVKKIMQAYHWPGNVRELENAIERAVILSDDGTEITQKLLAIELSETRRAEEDALHNPELTSLEDYFVNFVQEHQDNLTETELAEKLGISRKSLWERRQRLNIPRRKTRKRGRRVDQTDNPVNHNTKSPDAASRS